MAVFPKLRTNEPWGRGVVDVLLFSGAERDEFDGMRGELNVELLPFGWLALFALTTANNGVKALELRRFDVMFELVITPPDIGLELGVDPLYISWAIVERSFSEVDAMWGLSGCRLE